MTSAIEKTLGLPSMKEALAAMEEDDEDFDKESTYVVVQPASEEEYNAALQKYEDFEALEVTDQSLVEFNKEMDEVAKLALTRHETFADLAVNVDPKDAESFVAGASQMLTIALNARKAKMDSRLRIQRLAIDKERLAMQRGNAAEGIVEGEGGLVADRNDLLDRILGKKGG